MRGKTFSLVSYITRHKKKRRMWQCATLKVKILFYLLLFLNLFLTICEGQVTHTMVRFAHSVANTNITGELRASFICRAISCGLPPHLWLCGSAVVWLLRIAAVSSSLRDRDWVTQVSENYYVGELGTAPKGKLQPHSLFGHLLEPLFSLLRGLFWTSIGYGADTSLPTDCREFGPGSPNNYLCTKIFQLVSFLKRLVLRRSFGSLEHAPIWEMRCPSPSLGKQKWKRRSIKERRTPSRRGLHGKVLATVCCSMSVITLCGSFRTVRERNLL